MLFQCWTSVADGGPTSNQHYVNVSCLLDWCGEHLAQRWANVTNIKVSQRLMYNSFPKCTQTNTKCCLEYQHMEDAWIKINRFLPSMRNIILFIGKHNIQLSYHRLMSILFDNYRSENGECWPINLYIKTTSLLWNRKYSIRINSVNILIYWWTLNITHTAADVANISSLFIDQIGLSSRHCKPALVNSYLI